MDAIRIGELRFALQSAELSCLTIPDGTLDLGLSVLGVPAHGLPSPHFRLDGIRITGRSLDDVAGHVTELPRGACPDPRDPRGELLLAWLYLWSHEEATASRITWGAQRDNRLALAWSGRVPHLDRYDLDAPEPFELNVDAEIVHYAFEPVGSGLYYAEEDEVPALKAVLADLIPAVAADLTGRDWFARMPFSALDLIVRVDAAKRRWPAAPPRLRDYAAGVVLSVDARLTGRARRAELRAAFERQIAEALARFEARLPGTAGPVFLK